MSDEPGTSAAQGDLTREGAAAVRTSRIDSLASGTSWSLMGQVAPMIVTVFLTPYILHGLGVVRYGLFVLTGSLVTFLGTFDGGIKGTAQRYFAIYAGAGDVARATKLLVSLLLVIGAFGVVLSATGWFVAAPVVSLIGVGTKYQSEATFLFRTLGILIAFSFIHNLFVSILQAHFRFAYIVKTGFGIYALWTLGLISTVHFHWGLRGIAVVFVVQQVFLTVVIMPASFRYLQRRYLGLLPRKELVEFLSFGARVQVSSLSGLINMEFDTLIIGAALSVRSVSFYNAGANFAENIGSTLLAALSPAQTTLANTFGRGGESLAFEQFKRLQRVWVISLSGWFAVAGASAYFAIDSWLGSDFKVAGIIAVVALATQGLFLLSGVLRAYCSVTGRPGLQSKFGVFSVVINVLFTVPLVFTGAIGVAAATGVGQLAGLLYLVRLSKRTISVDVPNPFRSVPLLSVVSTAGVVTLLELAIRPVVPSGGLGLIACGLPAGLGLVFFLVVSLGPRNFVTIFRSVRRNSQGVGPKNAVTALLFGESV